jgi:hypothetical protein
MDGSCSMTWPVPTQYPISTAYGKRGSYWSCNKDSSGNGVHTGADFAAPLGTPLYATIAGQVRHRNYGSAFGSHQFAISPDPGQPFADGEVFYAHARKRVADGTYVQPGDWVGEVGDEGNVTGAHLHYEFHPDTKNVWNCSCHADPAPTLEGSTQVNIYDYDYSGKPSGTLNVGQSYVNLDIDEWDAPRSGLEHLMVYLNCSGFVFDGSKPGRIRVTFERDPNNSDRFGYQDFVVVPGIPELLITHATFEQGDGTRTWAQMKCMDGLKSMKVGTRYMKRAVVSDKG